MLRSLRKIAGYDALIAAAIFLVIFSAYLAGFFEGVELKTIDIRFQKVTDNEDCAQVAVIEITKTCLERISNWPIKRSIIASAIDRAMAAGIKTLAIDILFADKTSEFEDAALSAVFRKYSKKIILAYQFYDTTMLSPATGRSERVRNTLFPSADFMGASSEIGLINIEYDGPSYDGVFRTVNICHPVGTVSAEILSLKGVMNFSGKKISELGIPDGHSRGGFFINYYRKYLDSPFTKISLMDLLEMDTEEVAERLSGKLVFMGITAPAVPDMRLTPFKVMPGVEIHATVAGNILQSKYAYRVSPRFNFVIFLALLLLSGAYLRKFKARFDIPVFILFMGLYYAAGWAALVKYRIFADAVPPAFQVVFHFILIRLYQSVRQVYLSNKELQRMLDRIGGLYNIAKLSHQITDLQKLLNLTVGEISKILKCKRVSIVIEDPKSGSLILKAGVGFENNDKPIENLILNRKSPVISKVMETGESLLIKNVDEDAGLNGGEKGVNYQTKSFICVPLMLTNKAIGALSLTDKENFENFTEDDQKTITVFAAQIATNIEHIFRIADEVERRRMDKELEIASVMQKKLVPSGIKSISKFEVVGSYFPAKEVSGDYYDCIELDEEHQLLLVGDVSGKGVPAGLFMIMVRTFLHTIIKYERDLAKMIGFLNDYLTDNSESTAYLTVFMCILNIRTGEIEYVNGGHLSPIVLRNDRKIELLEVKNLICGMFNGVNYDVGKAVLNPGEFLYIFTDGITEAQAADDSMYGNAPLEELILAADREKSAAEHVEAILASVKNFVKEAPQSDDITILAVKALK